MQQRHHQYDDCWVSPAVGGCVLLGIMGGDKEFSLCSAAMLNGLDLNSETRSQVTGPREGAGLKTDGAELDLPALALNKTCASGQRDRGWLLPPGVVGGVNNGWIKHQRKE